MPAFVNRMRLGLVHREGQVVRIAGWISLIAGVLLCATLVWATIGFLLMGVGLLSLLVAENRRKRASSAAVETRARVDMPLAAPPAVPEPVVHREAPTRIGPPPRLYDRQAWRRLVESDADLAGVAAVLADYGQQYVDELAKEYLADTDKARLPGIVDGIIARAGKGVSPRGAPRPDGAWPAVDVRPSQPVVEPNAALARADRQPKLLPETKPEISEALSVTAAVEPAKPETVDAPVQPPIAEEPAPGVEDRNKTINSVDEELSELAAMLGKLSPDAATPRN
ncbi:MAG: hypothetical protein ACREEK_00195 [Bradyrhizobium sp.]